MEECQVHKGDFFCSSVEFIMLLLLSRFPCRILNAGHYLLKMK